MKSLEEREAAIDALIEHRRRVSGESDDFYGVEFLPVDYREANLWLTGLSLKEKKELLERNQDFGARGHLIHFALFMNPPKADYIRPVHYNSPAKKLLADFQNKKSKRVATARRELLARYEYLDADLQLAIRKTLLEGTCKTDWLKGCRLSMDRWDGSELPLVEQVWQKAREQKVSEVCFWASRVLLRQDTEEFLSEHQQEIVRPEGEDSNPTLYYYLCLRLANQSGFVVEKERLHVGDYYRLAYSRHQPFDSDIWLQDLYRATAELYVLSHLWVCEPHKLTKPDERFPNYRRSRRSDQTYWMRLSEYPTISDLLLFGGLLGATGVEEYLHYADRVEEKLLEMEPNPSLTHANKVIEVLRDCCPAAYQSYFEDYSHEPEQSDSYDEELGDIPF